MARNSITSATVVPTASEENCAELSDNSSVNPVNDINPVVPQESTAPQPSTESMSSVTIVPASSSIEAGSQHSQQPLPHESIHPRSRRSFIFFRSKNVNMRESDAPDWIDSRPAKHYLALVESFKQTQPFSRCPDGTYPANNFCVFCTKAKPKCVFFPCQHMCVCDECTTEHDMSPDCSLQLERCVCPICMVEIHLILPHSGKEELEYWNWVLATKSYLPSQFKLDFKVAARKLSDDTVADRRTTITSIAHGAGTTNPDQYSGQPTRRRNTWAPSMGRRASTYKMESNKNDGCMIL